MPVTLSDFLNFPFNGGRGIRGNQIAPNVPGAPTGVDDLDQWLARLNGLVGDGSLIREEFAGMTGATVAEEQVPGITVADEANAGYVLRVEGTTEFQIGNALRAARANTAIAVNGVNFYSNGDGDLLLTKDQAAISNIAVWVVRDIAAIRAAIAAAGAGSLTVEDEGSALATAARVLNFVGAGVTVTGGTAEKTVEIPGGVTREVLDLAVGGTFKRWSGGTLTAGQAHTLSVDVDSELGTFDDAVDGARLVVFVSARIAAGDEATLKIESDASGSFETLETVALSTSSRSGRLFAEVPTDVAGGYPEQVVRAVLTGSSTDNTVVEGMRLDVGMSRREPVSDDERARINALALSTDALSKELDGLTQHVLDTAAWVDTVESDHVHVGHEADPGGSAAPSHGHPTLTINQNAVNQALTLWVPRGVRPEGFRLQRVRGGTTTTWPQAGEYWRAYTTGLRLAEDTFHLDAYFLASETSDAKIAVNLNTGDLLKGQKNAIVTVLNGAKLEDGSVGIDALAAAVVARLRANTGRTRIQLTGGLAPTEGAGSFSRVNFGSSSERTLQSWATISLANRVTLEPGLYLCVIDAPFLAGTSGSTEYTGNNQNNARLSAMFRMNGTNVWSRQITNPYIRVSGPDVWDHYKSGSYELLVEVPAKTAVELQTLIRAQSPQGAVQFHDLNILPLN